MNENDDKKPGNRRRLPDREADELLETFKSELATMTEAIRTEAVKVVKPSFFVQIATYAVMVCVAVLLTYFFTTKSLATIEYVDQQSIKLDAKIAKNADMIAENAKQLNQLIGIYKATNK